MTSDYPNGCPYRAVNDCLLNLPGEAPGRIAPNPSFRKMKVDEVFFLDNAKWLCKITIMAVAVGAYKELKFTLQ